MSDDDPFALVDGAEAPSDTHMLGNGHVCRTEKRGHAQPRGGSIFEIVVDASEGVVPLWAAGSTLRYRYDSRSLARFRNPVAAKAQLRRLLGDALLAWGDATPVRFSERATGTDFEIAVRNADDCNTAGCTLARSFFPDAGRHQLVIYPKMFTQPRAEQVETLVHELGHVFGLRHFFAQLSETAWPSHVFGTHNRFSIMNYGGDSKLTDADRADLKALYAQVWSGALRAINGTPIKLFKPFSSA